MPVDVVLTDRLYFQYNSVEILSDISFRMKPGDYVGLVGPNGSGKTTLIKVLLGFYRPSRGMSYLFDRNISDFSEWYRIGYLPQKILSFNPHFPATVKEIVGLGLLSRKGSLKRLDRHDSFAVDSALDTMDIINIKNKLIGELSGGQQQRVLIARAIVSELELVILDEPTTALDPETRERFFGVLKTLNEDKRVSIIIVTHDIGTIGKYASKLLYLDKKIVFCGGFDAFCMSEEMETYFGKFSQHLICHRHDEDQKAGRD